MPDAPAATKREKAFCYFRSYELSQRQRLGDPSYELEDEYKMWYCVKHLGMGSAEAINIVATPASEDTPLGEQQFLTDTDSLDDYNLSPELLKEIAERRRVMKQAESDGEPPAVEDKSEVAGTPLVASCEWCGKTFVSKRPDLSVKNHQRTCKEKPAA